MIIADHADCSPPYYIALMSLCFLFLASQFILCNSNRKGTIRLIFKQLLYYSKQRVWNIIQIVLHVNNFYGGAVKP